MVSLPKNKNSETFCMISLFYSSLKNNAKFRYLKGKFTHNLKIRKFRMMLLLYYFFIYC